MTKLHDDDFAQLSTIIRNVRTAVAGGVSSSVALHVLQQQIEDFCAASNKDFDKFLFRRACEVEAD